MKQPFIKCALGFVLLSGCSQSADNNHNKTKPPSTKSAADAADLIISGVNLDQPLELRGHEPFWSVVIGSKAIIFTTPDTEPLSLPASRFEIQDESARLSTVDLIVNLSKGHCLDGMSEEAYPLKAQIIIKGETMNGCAKQADD